jgi:serine/threonine-protein kinase
LSDGLSDGVISAVSRIAGLRVAARTSSFSFKGRNLPVEDIAEQLRVRYVLEGSLRRSGAEIRVAARLFDAPDRAQVWTGDYRHRGDDLFALEDSIAGAIGRELTTGSAPPAAPAAGRTRDGVAIDEYLRGLDALRRRTSGADLSRAIAHFEVAVGRDAAFGRAWAGLASALLLVPEYGGGRVAPSLQRAREAIGQAVALDPASPEALAALGYLRKAYEWDWRGAEEAFGRALAVDSNAATVHQWYGELLDALGRYEEAGARLERAALLDPLWPGMRMTLGSHYLAAGRLGDGRRELERAAALQPGYWPAEFQLFLLDLVERRLDAAEGRVMGLGKATGIDPAGLSAVIRGVAEPGARAGAISVVEQWATARTAPSIVLASFFAQLGATDRGLDLLEAGARERDPFVTLVRWWPALEPLRRHPRFAALLRELNLAD